MTTGYSELRSSNLRLDGRVALITGAGRGIGAGAAIALADAGAETILLARTEEDLSAVCDEIKTRGGKASFFVCDVTDTQAVRGLISSLKQLDILVNNTGTNVAEPFIDVTDERLETLLAVNLKAIFWVAQAATRKMLEDPDRVRRGGSIINISSQFGHVGAANRSIYTMTKHGIEGLTKSIALELAPSGIRVNTLAPTYVDTPLVRRVIDTPEKRAKLTSAIPMGRIADISEVMAAIVFLASDASSMMTGSHLLLDGGWTAQ